MLTFLSVAKVKGMFISLYVILKPYFRWLWLKIKGIFIDKLINLLIYCLIVFNSVSFISNYYRIIIQQAMGLKTIKSL